MTQWEGNYDWSAPQDWEKLLEDYCAQSFLRARTGDEMRIIELNNNSRLLRYDDEYVKLRGERLLQDHKCETILNELREAFLPDERPPQTDPSTYNRIMRLLRTEKELTELKKQLLLKKTEYQRLLDSFIPTGFATPDDETIPLPLGRRMRFFY